MVDAIEEANVAMEKSKLTVASKIEGKKFAMAAALTSHRCSGSPCDNARAVRSLPPLPLILPAGIQLAFASR